MLCAHKEFGPGNRINYLPLLKIKVCRVTLAAARWTQLVWFLSWLKSNPNNMCTIYYFRAVFSPWGQIRAREGERQPVGHMWPLKLFNLARQTKEKKQPNSSIFQCFQSFWLRVKCQDASKTLVLLSYFCFFFDWHWSMFTPYSLLLVGAALNTPFHQPPLRYPW